MERLPSAHLVPHERLARVRAAAARAARGWRRVWARVAQQLLILGLTAVGFAGVLAMTFVLAQQAITVHQVVEAPPPRPAEMTIYFMRQPHPTPAHAMRATIETMRAAQSDVAASDDLIHCSF